MVRRPLVGEVDIVDFEELVPAAVTIILNEEISNAVNAVIFFVTKAAVDVKRHPPSYRVDDDRKFVRGIGAESRKERDPIAAIVKPPLV